MSLRWLVLLAQIVITGLRGGTPTPPAVVTSPATGIGQTTGTLVGEATPSGTTTTGYFEWGLTTAYGTTTPVQGLGTGASPVSIGGGGLTGLTCATLYHFHAAATNAGGLIFGNDATFTTSACTPAPSAPTVVSGTADTITQTAAILRGTGNPNSSATTGSFAWGLTTGYGTTTPVQSLGGGASPVAIDGGGITGLVCGTTYHFRATATNAGGTTNGSDATLATLACSAPVAPSITTGTADTFTTTTAILRGTANPNGTATSAFFNWGLTTNYGTNTGSQSIGAGTAAVAIAGGSLSGLVCNTTYHFRATGSNSAGTVNGSDDSFSTSACPVVPAPTVVTGAADTFTGTSAILRGTANPNSASTTGFFQWGLTAGYGNTTASQSLGSGSAAVAIGGGSLTGLVCNTTYHFRAQATNSGGTTNGNDATFDTSPCPPSAPLVTTGSASAVTATTATLNGTVNPNNAATTAVFHWGATTGYGNTTTPVSVGSGGIFVATSSNILGLTCNTTYHFRVSATNAGGTSNGSDATFLTGACAGPRQLLVQSDFSYLGFYNVNINAQNSFYQSSLTSRVVSGDLRFLVLSYAGSYVLDEFSIAGKAFGDTITARTNRWTAVGGLAGAGNHNSIWWDATASRLWTTSAIDYNANYQQTQVFTRTLNADGTIANLHGPVGLQNIGAKRTFGGAQATPAWFQSQYGVGPYMVGWGGYTSLVANGSVASMGATAYTMPDPAGYANNTEVPSGSVKILMDHYTGSQGGDWYAGGGTVPTVRDRGARLATAGTFPAGSPINYFDGGDPRPNPSTPPTVAPAAGAQWLSPIPQGPSIGQGRFVWGDSYHNSGNWIDGTNRYGFVQVASVCGGKCYYMTSDLHFDSMQFELHIFNPADLGAAALGQKQAWQVQPASIGSLTLPGMGSATQTQVPPISAVGGATYDTTGKRLYLMGCASQGIPNQACRMYVFAVNDNP